MLFETCVEKVRTVAGKRALNTNKVYQPFDMVNPSCASSMVSMATSFLSDFKSVPVIFVGHALDNVQVMVGFPDSSNN